MMHALNRRLVAVAVAAIVVLQLACSPDRDAPGQVVGPSLQPDPNLAAITQTTAWYNYPGGVAVALDAADNVFTAYWDYNPAGDIYLTKRSPAGAILWETRYDNTDNTTHEVATWVEADRGGNVLVSGTIRSGYSNPVDKNSLVMKFAPDGQLLWRQVFATTFDGSSTRKVLVDAADNVYVFGIGMSPGGMRTTVRKFSPNGTLLWAWFDPVGVGAPLNIKWGRDGNLVIAARAIYGAINGFANLDPNGNTIWTLAGIPALSSGDIAGDATGNSYVVYGAYSINGGTEFRKLSPAGALLWQRSSAAMTGQRVEVGSDNLPVLSGYPATGAGAAFMKFDASGNQLWQNLDADGPGTNLLAHGMLMLDAADDAYLAASNMSQMGVVKVRGGTGGTDWLSLIPSGYAVDLAFGQNGSVFVTGGTTARIDQSAPPPLNTAPVVTLTPTTPTTIRVNGSVTLRATLVDPDVGDGPWPYTWRWGNGAVTGTWPAPGNYTASRTYTRAGTFSVRVVVTDARGAKDTSNVVTVTVR